MRAVGSFSGLPIDDAKALQDIIVDVPSLRAHDILVRVLAVSVNPVDVERRGSLPVSATATILGHEAAGIVAAVGPDVTMWSVGDEVWYAGDISRPGTNAEFHAVDERIVARKPASLSFGDAAALPVAAITAWNVLFERFRLDIDSTGDLLVMEAACGVGSMMIQLAKALTGVRVIATADGEAARNWVLRHGADLVIDHHDFRAQAGWVAPHGVDYLFSPRSNGNVESYASIVKPFGHITAVDESADMNLLPLKEKSIAWHWEFMFTRSLFGLDMIAQRWQLSHVADLIDRGTLKTTATKTICGIDAEGIGEAHRDVESGRMVGKVVVIR
jgi:zinc-binding alcohol dehydrogenase family protein